MDCCDNEGKPYKLQVSEGNGTYTGYYVLNQQGDVIAILNANGVKVVSYEYNAWGQIKKETASVTNPGSLFLQHNALKYRGYYYDADLGLYYLGSCFYDQNICRFVNADTTDVPMANPSALTDKNMYSYCDNNPVMRADDGGEFWNVVAGAVIGGAISAATQIASNMISGDDWSKGVLMATATGAASGILSSTGTRRIGQIIGNTALSAIGETLNQRASGSFETKAGLQAACKAIGKAAVAGAIGGAIGGNGMRYKSGSYYAVAQKAKTTAQKVFGKKYSNPNTAAKMLSNVINSVKRTGYKESWKTGWKFLAGSISGQYLTITRRKWV